MAAGQTPSDSQPAPTVRRSSRLETASIFTVTSAKSASMPSGLGTTDVQTTSPSRRFPVFVSHRGFVQTRTSTVLGFTSPNRRGIALWVSRTAEPQTLHGSSLVMVRR